MQISDLRLHPIAIADGPLRSSYGLHAPYALRTIVELRTTSGLVGISETYGGDGPVVPSKPPGITWSAWIRLRSPSSGRL